jgi:hypothetical protein
MLRPYIEMWNLLTEAYLQDKVNPWSCPSCFVGNMLGGDSSWSHPVAVLRFPQVSMLESMRSITRVRGELCIMGHGFTVREIAKIEENFLTALDNNLTISGNIYKQSYKKEDSKYEDALFLAFESTLELLKKIYITKGETVDMTVIPTFTKRETVVKYSL